MTYINRLKSKGSRSGPMLAVGMEGYYTLRAMRGSGIITREHSFRAGDRSIGPFHNLITNTGLARFMQETSASVYGRCLVGTGTTPPDVENTQLEAFVGTVGSTPTGQNTVAGSAPDYYGSQVLTWRGGVGSLGTQNLTEIGIGGSSSNDNLFSRELIRDSSGQPVSFPISSDEQLEVTYELRIYPPMDDAVHTVNIDDNVHEVTVRPIQIGTNKWGPQRGSGSGAGSNAALQPTNSSFIRLYEGGLAAPTSSSPTGGSISRTSISQGDLVPGTYQRNASVSWSASAGSGTFRTLYVEWLCCAFQMEFSPPIVKSAEESLTLSVGLSVARR